MLRIFLLLTILLAGCATAPKVSQPNPIAENNKDVLILSSLVRYHLKNTNARAIKLDELLKYDTLKRISNSFKAVELKTSNGYISVYYTLSPSRQNSNITLTAKETEMLTWRIWTSKKTDGPYDGEMRFAYGEKLFHHKKIIVGLR